MIYATHDPMEALAMGGRIVIMSDGVVQQEGTAESLYDVPDTSFVAEFIGPPMNLIQGTLKQDRDSFVFKERDGGTIEVRLPVAEFPKAGEFAGQAVLLGIRPEEIAPVEVTQTTDKYPDSFPAIVELVEARGCDQDLYLQTGAHRVVCRTPRPIEHREAGHRGRFELKLGKVCLFDPVSGRRIS
jgi:multiple sugar transport system ATP-binding protein